MNKSGPILIIEDDLDDQLIIKECFLELDCPNKIVFCADGILTLEYLDNSNEEPFLILCDVNLPKLNGFELMGKVVQHEHIRSRCIPFMFISTSVNQNHITDAYLKSAHGFFQKPCTYNELLRILRNIVEYWKDCHAPECVD